MDNVLANISLYLSCFDFDKFVGVRTERELEVEGMRLIEENKLWAGIVFVDVPDDGENDELPEVRAHNKGFKTAAIPGKMLAERANYAL